MTLQRGALPPLSLHVVQFRYMDPGDSIPQLVILLDATIVVAPGAIVDQLLRRLLCAHR